MTEQFSAPARRVFVCAIALISLACSDPDSPTPSDAAAGSGGGGAGSSGAAGSSAGGGGAGGTAAQAGKALTWGVDGFVAADTNPFAIQGPFYFYSDCDPPTGLPCTAADASLTGADGKPGWSVDGAHVCAKGKAVQVESAMFSAQWGAGIALDLNSKGGEPGAPAAKETFDLTGAGVRGFAIDISGSAPARIRINLTMPGLADSNFVDAKIPGTTTFNVADAKQGSWVTSKTPLDPSKVEALQFQVFTTAATPTPFDFCIDAIRVISDADVAGGGG